MKTTVSVTVDIDVVIMRQILTVYSNMKQNILYSWKMTGGPETSLKLKTPMNTQKTMMSNCEYFPFDCVCNSFCPLAVAVSNTL